MFSAVLLWLTIDFRRQTAIREDLMSQGAAWVGFTSGESDFESTVLYTKPIVADLRHHDRLKTVELKGYDVTPDCIERLSKLGHIDNLYFISCDLCDDDLVHLPETVVKNLLFWNANISDAAIDTIVQIRTLKKVCFKTTSVTLQGVEKLQSALPELEIVSVR